MSNNPVPQKPHGRHRASPPCDDPSNVEPLEDLIPTQQIPVVPQTRRDRLDREREAAAERKQHHKTATLATGSMFVLTAAGGALGLNTLAAPARSEIMARSAVAPELQAAVTAADAPVVFDRPKVNTEAAPPPPPPPPAPAPVVRVEQASPAPAPVKSVATTAPPPPAPAAPPASTLAARIAAAALAQVGVSQDCTMLVTNSLVRAGKPYFHDWPAGYLKLGTVFYDIKQAVPGDLIWYRDGTGGSVAGLAHIAVYIGNGQAVHGGWDGWTTKVFSVNVGSGPGAFVRVS